LEYPQPFAQKIDLTKTEEELMKELKVLTGAQALRAITTAIQTKIARYVSLEIH
jgi:hypothetical protein